MISSLIQAAHAYLPDLNSDRLKSAYEFAKNAHAGQFRKDGSPYITHPVHAAKILTELHVDEDTLIACLLHDVPEDTNRTLDELSKEFGGTVGFLVEGITKLSKVHYRNDMEERQVESLKKLFIHTAQDPRIILIKLADRLHNMRTLEAIPDQEKRERIARETLEIYVPIANLLGIWDLKNQLEDCCFKALNPEDHKKIQGLVEQSSFRTHSLIEQSITTIERLLKSKKIKVLSVEGRQKNLFGIDQKMKLKKKSFKDIYDIVGLRVIVPTVGDCYQVLGVLHQSFTPKMGRLKDYIAIPKSNGYQSIHTTVFGVEGAVTEFQIRTQEMHLESEFGITAHYFYRHSDGKQKKLKKKLEKKYLWVQNILNMQRDIQDNDKFMKNLKLDIFKDRIFVFTPKGDVVDLPKGSSVIDFAYHVHSEVGTTAETADINDESEMSLMTRLKNGDTVKVNCSDFAEGPQVDWLNHVQTNLARNSIKTYLKERDRALLMESAVSFLDRTLQMFGLSKSASLSSVQRNSAQKLFGFKTWEQLIQAIGDGTLEVRDLIRHLFTFDCDPALDLQENRVCLRLQVDNRVGLLKDVSTVLSEQGVNIIELHTQPGPDPSVTILQICLMINCVEQYEDVINMLNSLDGVHGVNRFGSSLKSGNA